MSLQSAGLLQEAFSYDLKVGKAAEFLKLTDKSFFTRLLQMLSEGVCNGRSDRPLISVAA